MGSKNRIAKHILPIMLAEAEKRGITTWVEPFVGGDNMIDKVPESYTRIGYDSNEYLIELLKYVTAGGLLPDHITKECRSEILSNTLMYDKWLVGYVGFICGFGGDFNGGYAGYYPESRRSKTGKLPSYQKESSNSLLKQAIKLSTVEFVHSDYRNIKVPNNSIIYCDPPYANCTGYNKSSFEHVEFWEWARNQSQSNIVFVSEYSAPEDFELVWSGEVKSSLSANGKSGGNKVSVEKLFKV